MPSGRRNRPRRDTGRPAKVGAAPAAGRDAASSSADPCRRLASRADIDQCADQVAHHVVQKSIGTEVEQHQIALPRDVEAMQGLDRRLRLAIGGAERREIMLAEQASSRRLHRLNIQRAMEPADLAVHQCRGVPARFSRT